MLQHFFLTYSKGFNEKYGRTGSLLQHPFKRINIKDEKYLRNLIIYIHNNPIKHDFCSNIMDYEWTSYFSHLSYKYTRLSRDFVLDLFSDRENYIYLHESINFFDDIGSFLID